MTEGQHVLSVLVHELGGLGEAHRQRSGQIIPAAEDLSGNLLSEHRALPTTPDGRLQDLIETAKAHVRAKGEHPFRVIK